MIRPKSHAKASLARGMSGGGTFGWAAGSGSSTASAPVACRTESHSSFIEIRPPQPTLKISPITSVASGRARGGRNFGRKLKTRCGLARSSFTLALRLPTQGLQLACFL